MLVNPRLSLENPQQKNLIAVLSYTTVWNSHSVNTRRFYTVFDNFVVDYQLGFVDKASLLISPKFDFVSYPLIHSPNSNRFN
jgi:hypothetical protein